MCFPPAKIRFKSLKKNQNFVGLQGLFAHCFLPLIPEMKSYFYHIIVGFLLAGTLCAQQVRIFKTETVTPKTKGEYQLTGVMPNGKALLVTKPQAIGLYLVNTQNGMVKTLTQLPGTGYAPEFSKHGKYLLYRADDYAQRKRLSTLYKMKLSSGDTTVLEENKRVVSCPKVLGNDLVYTVEGDLQHKKFHWWILSDYRDKTFVLPEDLTPVLWKQGDSNKYRPAGEGSYIWISLSPNKRMMLFYVAGKGAFISDLNGRILYKPGDIMNPGWLNNDCIYGIGTRGSDPKSTSTDLVAFSLKTCKRLTITNTGSVNERNPYAFDKGRKIAYQTTSGLLNVVYFNIR